MALVDFAVDTVVYPGFKSHWGIEGYVFTKQTTDHESTGESADLDGTTWGDQFDNMLPGIQKATTKITGVHSGIRGQVGDILRPMISQSSTKRTWAARESINVLAPVEFQPCSVKKYTPKSSHKDVVKFDAELGARGAFNNGFILVSPKGNTQLAGATYTGPDDDSTLTTGATSYGGAIQMHMYDLSGGTTPGVTVTVKHSTDGTVWTALQAFVTATALTASTTFIQRIRIPSTTVINAHVQATSAATGTPTSCQAIVMYARGVDPDS